MANLYQKSHLRLKDSQVRLKPNFVVNHHSSNINPPSKRYGFLFVGRLSVEKGISTLLRAFKGTEYNLKKIEDGPAKANVMTATPASPDIEYLKFKGEKENLGDMGTSQALLFPSIWFEGMPITVSEPFSRETPVIASHIGPLLSLVDHHESGFHYSVGDWADLKNKLCYWSSLDTSVKDRLYQTVCDIFQQKYTWEQNIGNLVSLYNEVVHE